MNELYRRNVIRNQRLIAQTAEAIAALNKANIQPTLLKGMASLATTGDCQIGTRIVSDLDILVSPNECDQSVHVLAQLGYKIIHHSEGDQAHGYVEVKRPQDVTHIDLHRHPPGFQFFPVAAARIKDHCRLVPYGPAFAYVPSPTYQALVLIIHDQLHDLDYWLGKIALRHLLDLRDLARSREGIDWHQLRSFFDNSVARNVLDTQLVTLSALLDVDVPLEVRKRLLPRLQFRRRLLQLRSPAMAESLLLLTLLMDFPKKLPAMPTWSTKKRFPNWDAWPPYEFLRGHLTVKQTGKL